MKFSGAYKSQCCVSNDLFWEALWGEFLNAESYLSLCIKKMFHTKKISILDFNAPITPKKVLGMQHYTCIQWESSKTNHEHFGKQQKHLTSHCRQFKVQTCLSERCLQQSRNYTGVSRTTERGRRRGNSLGAWSLKSSRKDESSLPVFIAKILALSITSLLKIFDIITLLLTARGVRQGNVFAPLFFITYLDKVTLQVNHIHGSLPDLHMQTTTTTLAQSTKLLEAVMNNQDSDFQEHDRKLSKIQYLGV